MNIKRQMPKLTSVLLSFAMIFGNVLPAYATETIIAESALEETGQIEDDNDEMMMFNDDIEVQADSANRYEEIEVNYNQSSTYFVTIPKTITLGADKRSSYSVKVEGDIVANKQVCVIPVDGIADTEVFDFYMKDQIAGSTKEDVVAEVSQAKFYWNHEEAAVGYEEQDNHIIADGLSAGRWKGTFQMEISMRTDTSHIHNYVGEVTKQPTCTETGEKTYTCDCDDSYTEEIPAKGHHYVGGECTDCHEKDPNHKHSYTEKVIKEPTCTEAGEKIYTCTCGHSYTEEIPAKGHHFENGECTGCGERDPDYHEHSYTEAITKTPSCTEKGEKTYTCTCGHSYTEEIPAKEHDFKEEITKTPTCTETGEKTYTCDCGYSYTEEIPARGHHYGEDDKCTDCGELNPQHKHSYTETITREPTCTKKGEKIYTCGCGHSYTEELPAKGHNYVDGTCINCGKTSLYEVAPETAYSNWDYTLDEENNIITLNYYVGSETDVIVYANYIIDGKSYKTQIASNTDDATYATPYMFNGNPQTNCKNIKSIIFSDSIDTSNVTNMSFMFYECQSLIELDISNFNTSKVADMQYMFCNLQHLTSLDLSSFDTSNVTNMRSMFLQCLLLENLNIGNFDTSKVTDMQYMFSNCRALTSLDLSNFNTNNVTNMDTMFGGCYVLTSLNISSFDTSNVTNMRNMFSSCKSLTSLDLSNFNTGNVTNMEYMFYQCIALESLNVSRFDTSNVTNMMSMFCDNWKVTYLDVSGFDTSKTTDMRSMFSNCRALTELDLSNFNTSNVTMMSNMFYSCYSLTSLDLSNFDTSNVTNMNGMFKSCKALTNLDISSFDTKKVTDMREMFRYNSNLKAIYVDRNKWSTSLAASTKCPYGSQTQIGTYNMFSGCGTSSVTYR